MLLLIGDVNGRSLLTQIGKYQAYGLSEILDGRPRRAVTDNMGAPAWCSPTLRSPPWG